MAQRLHRRIAPVAGPALEYLDRAGVRLRRRRSAPALPTAARTCIGAIAHWRVDGREQYLIDTLGALMTQAPTTSCAIFTNEPDAVATVVDDGHAEIRVFPDLDGVPEYLMRATSGVACVRWSGLDREHPFRLTWGHKKLFRMLVRDQHAFTHGLDHLVYIEDDLALAPGALRYWTESRAKLDPLGLLPGFTRVEGPPEDRRLTSPYQPHQLSELITFTAPHGLDAELLVNMRTPYQGFYILDAPLAENHFATSAFRGPRRSQLAAALGGGWAVRERAAAGAIFDDLPPGLASRNVVPLRRGDGRYLVPLDVALVRHLPSNYYADESSKKATVPVEAAFLAS